MARNHLRFSVDAWRDADWLDLSESAQWLFTTILSQPKMSLVGAIDINVMRWAGLNRTATTETVQAALAELRDRRFVLIDEGTGELLVRSFTKNDLSPSRVSQQIAKGFWAAWKGVASEDLRRSVVDNCPEDIWEKIERHAPDDALRFRRSAPIDREPPPPSDRDSEPPIDNPPTGSHLPESGIQQPAAGRDAAAPDVERHRARLFADAVDVLVRRAMERSPARTNRHGYEHALRKGKHADHEESAFSIMDDWGDDFTPEELADWLEPTTAPPPDLRLVPRERCATCNDTTWLDPEIPSDGGSFGPPIPCPDCNQAATA